MKFERSSGILLHPTSLPGPYGIGDLGPSARRWVDWLAAAGCKLWQVLPLGPTGYGDSPYQSFSAFAGNPFLISPELLLEEGMLNANDLEVMLARNADRVDYGAICHWKPVLLARAFWDFSASNHTSACGVGADGSGPLTRLRENYDSFCAENAAWLNDYALFMAIKEVKGGSPWNTWPASLRDRNASALTEARLSLRDSISRISFFQFLFFRQWLSLKSYANGKGIRIIGDIPLFVAHDSADVWAHPELFFLDEAGNPTVVSGVPPDYFSSTGQLWGNPLYRWEVHKSTGYKWWLERLQAVLKIVDYVRLDHFRGFAGCWEVPVGAQTAEMGRWISGPGRDFLDAVYLALGNAGTEKEASALGENNRLPIIAEDLGEITPDVVALRERFGLPGMKILQFAFSGPQNKFLPHNYPPDCVVYTGTHDNDTTRGWYDSASEREKDFAQRYMRVNGGDFAWDLIRLAWSSVAIFALAPLQDFLNLGTETRMNYPGRAFANWTWRMKESELSEALQARVKELNLLYNR